MSRTFQSVRHEPAVQPLSVLEIQSLSREAVDIYAQRITAYAQGLERAVDIITRSFLNRHEPFKLLSEEDIKQMKEAA